MSNQYLLAIDVGTTNTKAMLFGTDGSQACLASRRHSVVCREDGWAEHDAEEVWWKEVCKVCREISESGIDVSKIAAVAVSALSPAMVPVDADGIALYPAMLYGLDRRAFREIEELREKYRDKVGSLLDKQVSHLSTGPKILWLKRNEPEIFQKASWFIGVPSYIVHHLTGVMVADYACYNIAGIPFSLSKFDWDDEMCADCGVTRENMPPLKFSGEVAGTITAQAAQQTGLPEGIPVAVGTGDFPAECCGYGTEYGQRLRIGLGTTLSIGQSNHMGDPVFPDYDPAHPRTGKRGGATSNGCSTIDWTINILSGPGGERLSNETLERMAADSPAGANGLIMLPYLNGEKAPFVDLHAKGLLFGLQRRHTSADIYRASLEAAAFSIRHLLDGSLDGVTTAAVVGGGVNIPGFVQTISNVMGMKLEILDIKNASLTGGAFLAGMACGIFKNREDINPWIHVSSLVEPNLSLKELYDKKYMMYRRLYEANSPFMHESSSTSNYE